MELPNRPEPSPREIAQFMLLRVATTALASRMGCAVDDVCTMLGAAADGVISKNPLPAGREAVWDAVEATLAEIRASPPPP